MPNRLARQLRNNATPAERVLWQQLRLLKAEGRHFRRQVPSAGFIADFACHYPKIVIELDGGQHSEVQAEDAARSHELERHGFRVIRFWNFEVMESLDGVVDHIRFEARLPAMMTYTHLQDHQTPTPALPARGREKME